MMVEKIRGPSRGPFPFGARSGATSTEEAPLGGAPAGWSATAWGQVAGLTEIVTDPACHRRRGPREGTLRPPGDARRADVVRTF
ncbi:Hypothetical protein MexAM1_META1p1825 [Methylorubrum extorquens AM1]|uniref:Uncharacterized protein n=1 Tax=Methylorubrum extorquens (strain ATCC 14718 / DSM 1338 / JCM 2805 / NCIMB 9133 / AM1) TaxID=272630 RepID=C5B1N3_METEA|nr:Hypothetical protein MexAM1_META1p1825 [Methylorubrum extorquens AM1]